MICWYTALNPLSLIFPQKHWYWKHNKRDLRRKTKDRASFPARWVERWLNTAPSALFKQKVWFLLFAMRKTNNIWNYFACSNKSERNINRADNLVRLLLQDELILTSSEIISQDLHFLFERLLQLLSFHFSVNCTCWIIQS